MQMLFILAEGVGFARLRTERCRGKTVHRTVFFTRGLRIPSITSQKQTAPANADAAYFGGGCGIRTHVGLLPNGFQDRLVMTASITLRMYVQVQTNLTFLIQFSRLRFDDPSSDFVPIILSHGGGFVKFSLCICGREVVY